MPPHQCRASGAGTLRTAARLTASADILVNIAIAGIALAVGFGKAGTAPATQPT